MFIEKYVDAFHLDLIKNTYDEALFSILDESRFKSIYEIFKKYKFYFIEDIITNYLDLFLEEPSQIEENIILLKNKLGSNFVYLIGEDMSLLDTLYF